MKRLCLTLSAMLHSLQCRGDASFGARLVGMNSCAVFLLRYGGCRLLDRHVMQTVIVVTEILIDLAFRTLSAIRSQAAKGQVPHWLVCPCVLLLFLTLIVWFSIFFFWVVHSNSN